MTHVPYTLDAHDPMRPPMGLIVLQTDETIESDLHSYFSDIANPMFVTRIASDVSVTPENLGDMKRHLANSADLLPKTVQYPVVGYGCTSASSVIGSKAIEDLVKQTCDVRTVTNPLRATLAQAAEIGVSKFALLSPYIDAVNIPLRAAFAKGGISTENFATFGEGNDSNVVRISKASIVEASCHLGDSEDIDAVFLSCTNLRTREAIPEISARLGKPVLSSNSALAWHMRQLLDT